MAISYACIVSCFLISYSVLKEFVSTDTVVPAAIEFMDIAGLVKGASEGAGLGNAFLSHI